MKKVFITREFNKSASEITKEEFIQMMLEDIESAKIAFRKWTDEIAEATYQRDNEEYIIKRAEKIEKIIAGFTYAPETPEEISEEMGMPVDKVREILSQYPIKTRLNLKGTLIVARDIAHARIKQMLDEGKPMPEYFKNHPVYYAGPAKTPAGMASGSFGPTTAGRMDSYVDLFQSVGGSMVMVAKGNRSKAVTDACKAHGGFYLGSIGGPAAILAKNSIKSVEVVDFPELGMEAVRKIYVENFPAFIIVDDKGNDFFADFAH